MREKHVLGQDEEDPDDGSSGDDPCRKGFLVIDKDASTEAFRRFELPTRKPEEQSPQGHGEAVLEGQDEREAKADARERESAFHSIV